VVVVFVRHENGREIARLESKTGEPSNGFLQLEAAVDKHASFAALDNKAVAFAAAAERCEAHH
jgi:hypothetical protein